MTVLDQAFGENWAMYLGDSAEILRGIPSDSVHLSVYSPPFISLYTYTASERDLGNCRDEDQFFSHFRFIFEELLRVTLPGRNTCVHVSDVPAMLVRDGYIGLRDFPGMTVRAYQAAGWIFHGRVSIDKNPQPQAIRVRAKGLSFGQMEKDAAWSRPALGDQILVFRKPGENAVPVEPDISRQDWILWARPVWYAADYLPGTFTGSGGRQKIGASAGDLGISETDTLNVAEARSNNDERHICALQLGTIERCVRLWSNQGEVVLSPFAGIGSEVYQAVKFGRRGIGIELNQQYYSVAVKNLRQVEAESKRIDLFSFAESQVLT